MEMNVLIAPLVMVLVEAIKRTERIDNKWLPMVAILIGFLCGIAWAIYEPQMAFVHLLQGALFGASAAGLYDLGKSAMDN